MSALDTLRRRLAHGMDVKTGEPILLECESTRALARVEAVIEAARQADLCPLPEPYRSNLRAALAALDSEAGGTASGGGLDEGGET